MEWKATHEGRIIIYLRGGDRRHYRIFDGVFVPLSTLCKNFGPPPSLKKKCHAPSLTMLFLLIHPSP